jgi:DNA-binding response OmpR family regulator
MGILLAVAAPDPIRTFIMNVISPVDGLESVCGVGTVPDLLATLEGAHHALVVLAASVAGEPRWSSLEQVRARYPAIRIIVLDSSPSTESAVFALTAGADDYMAETLSQREMVARIRVQLRRLPLVDGGAQAPTDHDWSYRDECIAFSASSTVVEVCGRLVPLGRLQCRLLEVLLGPAGTPVPVEQIVDRVWDTPPANYLGSLRALVFRLRESLGFDQAGPIRYEHGCYVYRPLPGPSSKPVEPLGGGITR